MLNTFIEFLITSYGNAPAITLICAIGFIILLVMLLRLSTKIFLYVCCLFFIGLVALYFIEGEDSVEELIEAVEEQTQSGIEQLGGGGN
jgi:hypothetical protein